MKNFLRAIDYVLGGFALLIIGLMVYVIVLLARGAPALPEPIDGVSEEQLEEPSADQPRTDSFLLSDGVTTVERIDVTGDGYPDLVRVGDEPSQPIAQPEREPGWLERFNPVITAIIAALALLAAGLIGRQTKPTAPAGQLASQPQPPAHATGAAEFGRLK